MHGARTLPSAHRALKGWTRRTPLRCREPHVWAIWRVAMFDLLPPGLLDHGSVCHMDGGVLPEAIETSYGSPPRLASTNSGHDAQMAAASISRRAPRQIERIRGQRCDRDVVCVVPDTGGDLQHHGNRDTPISALPFRKPSSHGSAKPHKQESGNAHRSVISKTQRRVNRCGETYTDNEDSKYRGRKSSDASLRRYVQMPRITTPCNQLTPSQQAHCLACENNLTNMRLGTKPPGIVLLPAAIRTN